MFTFAVIYASFCTTRCALEAWPGHLEHSESQPDPSSHSRGSHHDDPGDSTCVASDHLDAFVPADAGITQVDLGSVGHVNVVTAPIQRLRAFSLALNSFRASDLAPPCSVTTALYQQSSILRI